MSVISHHWLWFIFEILLSPVLLLYFSDLKLDNKRDIPLHVCQAYLVYHSKSYLTLIYFLITSNDCAMPLLFLVAVIRPLSMSFSFDASGKVYLAAYLPFSVYLLVVAAHLLSQLTHTHRTHCISTLYTHRTHSINTHISCHASVFGDGRL